MPHPEIIKAKLAELQILKEHEKPGCRENTVWAHNEQGGHFRLYKQRAVGGILSSYQKYEETIVSISGDDCSRQLISTDFSAAFGKPDSSSKNKDFILTGKKTKPKTYLVWREPIETSFLDD